MNTKNFSIRTTLLTIIGVLNLLIAVLTGLGVFRSVENYNHAQKLKRGTAILNTLYNTEKFLSLSRAASMAVLSAPPDTAKGLLDEMNRDQIAAYALLAQALDHLAGQQDGDVVKAMADARAKYQALLQARDQLNIELQRPLAARDHAVTDQLFVRHTDLIQSIEILIDAFSQPLYIMNGVVAQQMRFKYFIWEITEYAGREYAVIGRLIVENKAPTLALQEQLFTWRGRVEHGWEIAHLLLKSSGLEEKITPFMNEAETHYFLTFDQIKDMFYSPAALTAHRPYPLTIEIWLELASQAVDSLLALKDESLQETQNYVDEMARQAERLIALNVLLFLGSIGLSIYSWTVISRRVVRPVNAMVDTLYKATQGEPYRTPEILYQNDEIGKLGLVLEVFQKNLQRIEQTSHELAERRNYLNAVLSTMIDGIVAIDARGQIQLVNKAIQKMFGFSEHELMHQNVTIMMPEPTDKMPEEYLARFMVNRNEKYQSYSREAMAKRRDGSLFPVEMSITEMRSEGKRYFVGTLRDITENKKAEHERERYLKDLENSNRELDDFAYIASHDLKEPLRGLHNFSRFLLEDYAERLDHEGRGMLRTLASLTQQMEGLLNALLHYSRLGRTEMSIRETDLNQVVVGVLAMFTIKIRETGAKVEIVNKLPTIVCDHVRIAEVFQNLIGNALKYTDRTDPVITIASRTDHSAHPGEFVYSVCDNGIGIAQKNLDAVFKIFHRLHPKNAYGGGTGSGLTITKKIINQHGGKIWAESAGRNEGTCFRFTIPEVRPVKPASGAEIAQRGDSARRPPA